MADFAQTLSSGLSEFHKSFYYAEDRLNFRSNRRFRAFVLLGFVLSALAQCSDLAQTEIELATNLLYFVVSGDYFSSLFYAETTAVFIYRFRFFGMQLRDNAHIMDICRGIPSHK